MNKQRKTSHILNVFQYDPTTGIVTLPSSLIIPSPDSTENSTKVATTAWIREYVGSLGYATSAAVMSSLTNYLALTGGTLSGGIYINPTNTGVVGLDIASNTIRFRSDNLEGFKRQLVTTLSSGTLVKMLAAGYGGTYVTDLGFYTSSNAGENALPNIYLTGGNNYVGINTVTPQYNLDVAGTGRYTSTLIASSFVKSGGTSAQYLMADGSVSTNPGWLTGITSSQVTTALGYTPYNSSNPSGYITGISSGMVTTALGYTPYNSSNPTGYITSSGSISGNAGSANYALQLNGFAQQVEYTILTGPANGPVWKVRYDGGTANRYVDLGFKDGNGTYYEGFKIYNNGRPTWVGNTIIDAGNIGSQSVAYSSNSGALNGWGYTSYAYRNSGTGYYQVNDWIQMNGAHGIYWPNHYGLHLEPNGSSYGSLRVRGSKNSWSGINFSDSNVTIMANSGESGFHNDNYSWHFRWTNGTLYCHRSTYGGGTAYTVWDSGNLTNLNQLSNGPGYQTNGGQVNNLSTNYAGGQQLNPQVYFNNGIGLKVAMTASWGYWSDTMWVNGYAGGDVPWMCALHFQRNSQPRMAISAQTSGSTGYGTLYEVITAWNIADQTVSTANNLSGFDKTNPSFGAVYASNWFRAQGDCGLYTQDYGGHFRRNVTSYGTWQSFGYAKNGWGGYVTDNNYILSLMNNSGGDHGFHMENGRGWTLFHNYSNNCWGIGTDNTYSGDGFRCIKYGSAEYGWTTWSDRRAKENISSITSALDTVLAMRGVYFNYIKDEAKNKRVGFIAQELELVLPEAVRYAEEIDEYSVEYAQIVSVLAEAIKEQDVKMTAQEAKIQRLEQLVEQLINQ